MPEIDAFEALALSLHHNRGAYAILVGSGLSRAAGIPTGWEITLDLIKRLGVAQGAKDIEDWESWYRKKFKRAPSYSEVLDKLAATPAERRSILHGYIEPKKGEKARHPTKAHRAIAQLVVRGAVRVIITTNFDKLLENALREEGIEPTVIASEDALIGATPLIHAQCTVLKLHGDYLDARIKNTDQELGSYAESIDALLDEIFDRFGLVVAGWSGEWDAALRAAILRTANRRYAMYWTARAQPATLAQELIVHRGGRAVTIADADSFFGRLNDTLDALLSAERPHPESSAMAIALAKKYCRNDEYALEWTELIAAEVEKIRRLVNGSDYIPRLSSDTENVNSLVQQFINRTEILRSFALIAGRWGTTQAVQAIIRATSQLASWPPMSGITAWIEFRSFAGSLCFYWASIGLLARDEFQLLSRLMHSRVRTPAGELVLVAALPIGALMDSGIWKLVKGYDQRRYAGSDFLIDVLKIDGRQITLTSDEIEDLFDRLELLITFEFAQVRLNEPDTHFWTVPGLYIWRNGSLKRQRAWIDSTRSSLIKSGLLGGTETTSARLMSTVDEHLSRIPRY